MDQVCNQLNLQPFAESRFPRRRRSGNQHDADTVIVAGGNLLCDLGYLLFLHGFGDHDDLGCHAFLYRPVQVADVVQSDRALQGQMLLVNLKHFILADDRFQFRRIRPLRHTQQHAVEIGNQVKILDVAGGRSQAAIEIIDVAIQFVIRRIRHTGAFDQTGFVVHAPFTEQDCGIDRANRFQMERKVCVDDFTHPFLDLADRLLVYVFTVVNNAIIAFRDGMLQVQSR